MVALNILMPVADPTSALPPKNHASSTSRATSPTLSIPSSSFRHSSSSQDQHPLLPARQPNPNYLGKTSPQKSSSFWFITLPFVWLASLVTTCYDRITAWLLPNEPEPLDLQATLFFVAQAPLIFLIGLAWLPTFVYWFLGIRTSQAGDRGKAKGMRKTWTIRLALALSFLKVYLRYSDHLTIEECQRRSRSIPFMTAPAGIRVNKVKIPAFPYRSKAEAMLYDCISDEERALLSRAFMKHTLIKTRATTSSSMDAGMEMDSIQEYECSHDNHQEDQFAEGLDAEWLEYIGPEDTTTDMSTERHHPAAVLYFHGGGYYSGSKEEHRVLIGPLVKRLGKNIRILVINYRLAPQDPFPAALVDALSSYMWLLDQSVSESFSLGNGSIPGASDRGPARLDDLFRPNQIIFMGDSAGGGLALSLSLLLRDHGSLPQPLSLVTWSPWLDLTQSLPSFKENALTDCIPYEDFTHRYSEAVDWMFEDEVAGNSRDYTPGPKVRQRAQVYCPDSWLRIKYISPLFETDFKGIPNVFITCGSAERFIDECVLMAARLEEQGQPCRIDIHEDMPHIFPLFRFHTSASAALDRTSAYIRETVELSDYRNEVIIPISSASSSSNSSAAQSPLMSSRQFERPDTDSGLGLEYLASLSSGMEFIRDNTKGSPDVDRVNSASSISLSSSEHSDTTFEPSSSACTAKTPHHTHSRSDSRAVRTSRLSDPSESTSARDTRTKRTIVNVIDLSGSSVMSYHKQNRHGPFKDTSSYMDVTQRRYHRSRALTLEDVVSDATLYEWEVLLKQGYIPTRHWPDPPSREAC